MVSIFSRRLLIFSLSRDILKSSFSDGKGEKGSSKSFT